MKKSARKKHRNASQGSPSQEQRGHPASDAHMLYPPPALRKLETYELENAALQEILEAVVKLQTYIALRQRRQ